MNHLAYRWQNNLFTQSYRHLSWSKLLEYYRNKPSGDYFPLSAGKAKHLEKANEILENRFNLNNECYQLPEKFDWQQNPSADLEWLILLHKFYYLKELACAYDFTRDEIYVRKWVELIDSWIDQVPVDFIDTQVIGRRLQQWLISYRYLVGKWQSPSVMPDFFARFLESVNSQTAYLCEHLTPEGNHRTLELYAIFMVAVTFPELASAEYFLEFSSKHLLENIQKDLLADGVHRELSTDYHHTVLKNYLRFRELAGLNQIALPDQCNQLLLKALKFSCFVHKPDGFIPAINDGDCNSYLPLLKKAFAIYADPHTQYVLTQGVQGIAPLQRSIVFPDSGYCILRSDWQRRPYQDAHYLFFDCAQLGFGSHGHYDALNFEVAAYGRSLIVDPGRYTYCETGHEDHVNWRKYFKGTAAHNTVMIDGLDQINYQCERPIDREPDVRLDFFLTHEGFDWVQGRVISHRYPVIHERSIFFLHAEYWIVTDRLLTKSQHDYDLRFHLSPFAQDQVELNNNDDAFVISSPNLVLAQPKQVGVNLSIKPGFVSPEYGIKQPAPIISFSKENSDASCSILLSIRIRMRRRWLSVHASSSFNEWQC